MAVAVSSRTMGQTIKDCARLTGDLQNEGTATAGSTTTLTDANNERTPVANTNRMAGQYVFVDGGVGIGDAREVTSYGTIGVFTWIQAVALAPDTTSTWVRLSRRPQAFIDAINAVTRRAAWKQAQPYQSLALVTNNLLQYYGSMEEFSSGTSSAPDGWTLAGAGSSVARSSAAAQVGAGLYSVEVTAGGGAVATLTRTLLYKDIHRLDGGSLRLEGFIAENVAADAVLRVTVTDTAGVATNTDRTGTYTGNRPQELKDISTATIAIPNPVAAIAVQCRSALSAVTYFDDLMLFGGEPIRDYDLPPSFIGIEPVIMMESGLHTGQYRIPLVHGRNWSIAPQDGLGTTRVGILRMHQDLLDGRHLLIKGYRAPDVLAATSTAGVEPNPEWLALAAAVRILQGDPPSPDRDGRLALLTADLRAMEDTSEGDVRLGRHIIPTEVR